MKRSIIFAALAAASVSAYAGIDFETADGYTALGVYDCWEQSPFRTGKLQGNVAVVDNPDKSVSAELGYAPNDSEKVLGAQRSRFGSNLFGVRIDLTEKIQLSTTTQYVHVMVNRPVEGRLALVALGKRTDRDDQTGEEEQLWVLSNSEVKAGKWADAVFPIKGSDDVQLYSLILVPECESPHNATEDFLFYIDDIVVNDEIKPRHSAEFYEINYNKASTKINHSERRMNSLSITSPKFGTQEVTVNQREDLMLYYKPDQKSIICQAGETLTLTPKWDGSWMHGYVYLDLDNSGSFEPKFESNGYTPADGSELVAFSFYSPSNSAYGYDSKGSYKQNNAGVIPPSFTIPADLKPGVYRLRYIIDWNSVDPGGCIDNGNMITNNGGVIVDLMLNVLADGKASISANQLNGDVADADGNLLNNTQIDFGQEYTVKMLPAPGFTYSKIRVRHGFNLNGEATFHDNIQYRDTEFDYSQFDSDNCLTLPASVIDGDVFIEGYFVEEGTLPQKVKLTYNLMYNGRVIASQEVSAFTGDPFPEVTWETETSSKFYTVSVPEGTVEATEEPIEVTLTHELPFKVSDDFENAHWYNLAISSDKKYLTYTPGQSYFSLPATAASLPSTSDVNSMWAFVGNAFEGFKLYNRGAGDSMILSSSTNTASNTGGNTYPVLTTEPVPDTNNTYWIPTASSDLGADGFYLHQMTLPNNRMNVRDNRLAYWTGGADGGSTFNCLFVESTSGIEGIGADNSNEPAVYFNLQGIRVPAENLIPGIYIRRQGTETVKVLVK